METSDCYTLNRRQTKNRNGDIKNVPVIRTVPLDHQAMTEHDHTGTTGIIQKPGTLPASPERQAPPKASGDKSDG